MDPVAKRKSGSLNWLVLIAVLCAAAAGGTLWFRANSQDAAREQAAKAELTKLGALVVMDAGRVHVNSVNLSTLKSPEMLDSALAILPDLSRLSSLNVDGSQLKDSQAGAIGQLSSLQDLVLSNTQITDRALEQLGGLSRLNTIYLVGTKVTNEGLTALGRLGALKIVDVSGTEVSGGFEALAELSDLNWLVVQRLSLDGAALDAIGKLPSLTRLTLRESTYPKESLEALAKSRPGLAIDE